MASMVTLTAIPQNWYVQESLGTCASVHNLVLESRIQEYLELPYMEQVGAWK